MTEENEAKLRALAPGKFKRLAYFECGDGWVGLLEEVIAEAKKRKLRDLAFVQAKEKFGKLRVYTNGGNPDFWDYLWRVETRSGSICEICGAPGKLRGGGWIRALCDEHGKISTSDV